MFDMSLKDVEIPCCDLDHPCEACSPWDAEAEQHWESMGCRAVSDDGHFDALRMLEGAVVQQRMFVADQYRIMAEVVRSAEDDPDPWVGRDPTLDPGWQASRRRTAATVRRERREFAVRAAVADMAVRLRVSEATVRTRAAYAQVLRERTPTLWASFLGGCIEEQNAVAAAQVAGSLPFDDPATWKAFDEEVAKLGKVLVPVKFRVAARALRERLHPESIEVRHKRAVADRRVWSTPELDGMATITAFVPAAKARDAMVGVEARARHLRSIEGEERTLPQLRADVFLGLLTTGPSAVDSDGKLGKGKGRRSAVAITVPVMTLLGQSDEPATLDGYGPIDIDTAKRIAGDASSWVRILTHPVTGTVVDVDRKTYRVPAALRRWLGVHHPTCVFPGCSRPARECDLDHLIDWQYGGTTSDDNLAPECDSHHPVRHETLWRPRRARDWEVIWTSPSGFVVASDPPPF